MIIQKQAVLMASSVLCILFGAIKRFKRPTDTDAIIIESLQQQTLLDIPANISKF
jgi:hypothetical protein